jgi:putative membrane protein
VAAALAAVEDFPEAAAALAAADRQGAGNMMQNTMSPADHTRVSDAVHAAEQATSGEIVTIIADHSDRYLDVALWWSIAAAILSLAAVAAFPGFYSWLMGLITGGWFSAPNPAEMLELALAIVVVVFVIVRLILQWIPARLVLTPGIVKSRRVRRRAIRYFKVGAERRTAGRTGILIYLSVIERRAEIVADEAIHSIVPNEKWGAAMAAMLADVAAGRIADGIVAAVRDVGAILAEHFPRADDDRNELPDRLIEL